MRNFRSAALFFLPVLSFIAFPFAAPAGAQRAALDHIRLPPGFRIEVLAAVPAARSLALGTQDTLFVGSRSGGRVHAVSLSPAAGGGFAAGKPKVVADGLRTPNGVAFRDGALYIGEISRILRLDKIESQLDAPPAPVLVFDGLPGETHHGWKFIRFGPDGYLYVPVGAPCNVCARDADRYALIGRIRIEANRSSSSGTSPSGTSPPGAMTSPLEVFARGVRNTVGFDWDPATRELWFTDNGRDWMGDDLPADELNHAPRAGMHFGFPHCHQGDLLDGEFGRGRSCGEFTPPAQKLGPHVASLGMRFYTGKMFPPEYRNQIFIAEHGSWNRSRKTGYRISLVRHEGGKALSYESFAEGWLQNGAVSGRPVDIEILPDGSLAVSDDHAGLIYRISYSAPASAAQAKPRGSSDTGQSFRRTNGGPP